MSNSTDLDKDAQRARFERAQMKTQLVMLQVLAVVQLLAIAALAYGMWETGGRMRATTSEVNGLRENIQGLFSTNVPLVEQLNQSVERANTSATTLETRLNGDFGIETKLDGAMEKMKTEIPKSIEGFFDQHGAEMMKSSFDDPAIKAQISATIKDSMNDPSVKAAIEESVKDSFRKSLLKKE